MSGAGSDVGACLDDSALQDFVDGRMEESARARAFEHIGGCELCRALVAESMHAVGDATTHDTWTTDGADNRVLAAGERVGRYVVIGLVGAGGMGVVYAAYDPELDRKVALKLLRHAPDGTDASTGLEQRLRREAQSMARLTHPNIVTVHDVGSFEDRLFIAMEFVSGRTFGEWLREKARSWREVRGSLLAAGRGLAAAHAAGIVHRDFKPDNVLVSHDGRVLVSDFGLARTFDARAEHTVELTAEDGGNPMVTRTRGLIGTPAYMAPEQVAGRVLDARTDIYAFCVTAFEAFVGRRPFRAQTLPELRDAILSGRVKDEAGDQHVPRWLRRAISKGMEKEPSARYRTMEEVLAQLGRDPARTLTRVLAVSAALLVIGAVFALNEGLRDDPERRCSGAQARLADVWSEGQQGAQRSVLEAAFARISSPWAKSASQRVAQALDGYARQWMALHTEACRATRVRGEQSEAVLEHRMACLESRRSELQALVEFVSTGDDKTLQEAPRATARLSSLDACSDIASLTDAPPLPLGVEARAEVDAVSAETAKARAALALGDYTRATPLAEEALRRARALSHAPLVADAALALARAYDGKGRNAEAEAPFRDAIDAALAGKRDTLLFEALTDFSRLLIAGLRREAEAPPWLRLADAMVARAGSPPLWRARALACKVQYLKERKDFAGAERLGAEAWHTLKQAGLTLTHEAGLVANDLAATYFEGGQAKKAIVFFERALAVDERVYGPDHPRVAGALSSLGRVLFSAYDFKGAVVHYARGIAIHAAVVGQDSLALWRDYNMLGTLRMYEGDHAGARANLEDALRRVERVQGQEFHHVALPLANLAVLEARDGRFELARKYAERSVAIVTKHFGAEHIELAAPWEIAALVALRAGRFEEARAKAADATALRAKSLGLSHPDLALTMDIEAYALIHLGRAADAAILAERSRALREKAPGPEHPDYADSLTYLAIAELELGRRTEASAHLASARKVHETTGGEMTVVAFREIAEARAELAAWAQLGQKGSVASAGKAVQALENAIKTLSRLPGFQRECDAARALLKRARSKVPVRRGRHP